MRDPPGRRCVTSGWVSAGLATTSNCNQSCSFPDGVPSARRKTQGTELARWRKFHNPQSSVMTAYYDGVEGHQESALDLTRNIGAKWDELRCVLASVSLRLSTVRKIAALTASGVPTNCRLVDLVSFQNATSIHLPADRSDRELPRRAMPNRAQPEQEIAGRVRLRARPARPLLAQPQML